MNNLEAPIHQWQPHDSQMCDMIFIPSSQTKYKVPFIASSNEDRTVKLTSLETLKPTESFRTYNLNEIPFGIRFIPPNENITSVPILAAGCRDSKIYFCNLDIYEEAAIYELQGHQGIILGLCYIPSANPFNQVSFLASCCTDKTIRTWQINKILIDSKIYHLNSDIFASPLKLLPSVNDEVRIGRVNTKNNLIVSKLPRRELRFKIEDTVFFDVISNGDSSQNQSYITVGNSKGEVKILDMENKYSTLKEFKTEFGKIRSVMSIGGKDSNSPLLIGISDENGAIKLFNFETCEMFSSYNFHINPIVSAAVFTFGKRNIYFTGDKNAKINFFTGEDKVNFSKESEDGDELECVTQRKFGNNNYLLTVYKKSIVISTVSLYKKLETIKGNYKNFLIQDVNH